MIAISEITEPIIFVTGILEETQEDFLFLESFLSSGKLYARIGAFFESVKGLI